MIARIGLNQLDGSGATDGQVPVWNPATQVWEPGTVSGGGGITVQDENGNVGTGVTQIDFQGAGVSAASGTGEVVVTIPGGSGGSSYPPGSADIPPGSPNAKDDEFDGTSSVTWTSTPTDPNAFDIDTSRDSHMYLKAATSGATLVGKLQAIPGAFPFTVITKIAGHTARANYHKGGGIILLPASPNSTSGVVYIGHGYNSGHGIGRAYFTNMGTTFQNQAGPFAFVPGAFYLKLTMTSATSLSWSYSLDGHSWIVAESSYTAPFTIANIGIGIGEESAAGGVEAFFDFFRVT